MQVTPITNPVDAQSNAFNGKVGKSVYRYLKLQKHNILHEKTISKADIKTFMEIVPQALERLKGFMGNLHPDTVLEFKINKGNMAEPFFYNKKTNTEIPVVPYREVIPDGKIIYLGKLNIVLDNFFDNFFIYNIKTIDAFSKNLVKKASQGGNSPEDIDNGLFEKMFTKMQNDVLANNFISNLKMKYYIKKIENLAPEFKFDGEKYIVKLINYKKKLIEYQEKQLAEKQLAEKHAEKDIVKLFKKYEIK